MFGDAFVIRIPELECIMFDCSFTFSDCKESKYYIDIEIHEPRLRQFSSIISPCLKCSTKVDYFFCLMCFLPCKSFIFPLIFSSIVIAVMRINLTETYSSMAKELFFRRIY
jgi:hypothetical protein